MQTPEQTDDESRNRQIWSKIQKNNTGASHTHTRNKNKRIIYLVGVTQTHRCTVSLALTAGTQYDATKNWGQVIEESGHRRVTRHSWNWLKQHKEVNKRHKRQMTTKVKQEVSNRNTEYKALHKRGLIRSHRKQQGIKLKELLEKKGCVLLNIIIVFIFCC